MLMINNLALGMKSRIIRVTKFALLFGAAIYCLMVFMPRTYPVPPLQKRAGTQYLQLPTGSRIAYIRIAANNIRSKAMNFLPLVLA
jgi:proline iminopeptidase